MSPALQFIVFVFKSFVFNHRLLELEVLRLVNLLLQLIIFLGESFNLLLVLVESSHALGDRLQQSFIFLCFVL